MALLYCEKRIIVYPEKHFFVLNSASYTFSLSHWLLTSPLHKWQHIARVLLSSQKARRDGFSSCTATLSVTRACGERSNLQIIHTGCSTDHSSGGLQERQLTTHLRSVRNVRSSICLPPWRRCSGRGSTNNCNHQIPFTCCRQGPVAFVLDDHHLLALSLLFKQRRACLSNASPTSALRIR